MELERNRALLLFDITHNAPIGTINKWNFGILNKSWQREFYWVSPEDSGIFELYRTGVPASTLLRAGYEKSELLAGGYSQSDLVDRGLTQLQPKDILGLNPSIE